MDAFSKKSIPLNKYNIEFHNSGEKAILGSDIANDIDYASQNKHAVTVLYSQPSLPLLSSNTGELVNLVDLPNVGIDGNWQLEDDLECERTLIVQQNLDSLEICSENQSNSLLKSQNISKDINIVPNDNLIIKSNLGDGKTIIPSQLIQISSPGVSAHNSNLHNLPLSFVDESGEVTLLSNFNHISLAVQNESSLGNEISQNQNDFLYTSSQNQNFVPSSSHGLGAIKILAGSDQLRKVFHKSKNVVEQVKVNQVGRPRKLTRNKIIGYGSSAISAQGFVQDIGNRKVTILPRPEDLKKLIDTDQIVLKAKDGSTAWPKLLRKKISHSNDIFYHLSPTIKEEQREEREYLPFQPDAQFGKEITSLPKNSSAITHQKKKRGRKRKKLNTSKPPSISKLTEEAQKNVTDGISDTSILLDAQTVSTKAEHMQVCQVADQEIRFSAENSISNKPAFTGRTRVLPPRNRGLRYKKFIQKVKDEESDEGEESDASSEVKDSYLNVKLTSGVSRKGRPRKMPTICLSDTAMSYSPHSHAPDNGTQIIQLSESLKPIEASFCPSTIIEDNESNGESRPKLVITVSSTQRLSEGEYGEYPLLNDQSRDVQVENGAAMTDGKDDIIVIASNEDCYRMNSVICVEENGEYHEKFECQECGETSSMRDDHIEHLRSQHRMQLHECFQCKKIFRSKNALQNHMLLHDYGSTHTCCVCRERFFSADMLSQHSLVHDNDSLSRTELVTSTVVSEPDQEFSDSRSSHSKGERCKKCYNLKTIDEEHNCNYSKLFVCDICKMKFMTSVGLNRHRRAHNRTSELCTEERTYRCMHCQATFSYEGSLTEHIKSVHGSPAEIGNAGASAGAPGANNGSSVIDLLQEKLNEGYAPKTSELYDEPNETETNEFPSKDPFKCGVCDDQFKDIDVLCGHYSQSHWGSQPFHCVFCSIGCSTLEQLRKHEIVHREEEKLSTVPLGPSNLTFLCKLCPKRYKTRAELMRHSKTHIKAKVYQCSFCSAAFHVRSSLEKHLLVHTGQRPFVCDICLKSFRQSAALVRHKLWTHRLKNKNKCELCDKTFFTKNLLLFHLDFHGEQGVQLKNRLLATNDSDLKTEFDDLEEGKELENDDVGKKNRTCEYCGKECSSLVALLAHKISHKFAASYRCNICHRTFREERYLKKHRLTHKGSKRWKCDICPKAFTTKLTLIRHSNVHIREAFLPGSKYSKNISLNEDLPASSLPAELTCQFCNLTFDHKTHYVRHKLLHSDIPLLKCGLCDKMFVHKSDLIRHKVMHSFMFSCKICNRNFHKRSLYSLHMKKHSDAKPFSCDKCHKKFSSSGNFKIHRRIHSGEKPYHCNVCDYKCSQSGRLLKHKRMHCGTKVAQCKYCSKSFADNHALKVHVRIHTGERPYRCNICFKSFRNGQILTQHVKDHAKEETFKCMECSHKFKRSEYLQKHKLFHKMERQVRANAEMGLDADANIESPLFMCDLCGRVFDKKKYLYNHHNVHSREKFFSCSFCGKQLQSRLALKNHALIHTGEMPHKCYHCQKEFRNSSNLRRHEKTHSSSETFVCDVCGDSLTSIDALNEHKQLHLNLIVMNPANETTAEVNEQLYLFDGINEEEISNHTVEDSRHLVVENAQPQFLVEHPHHHQSLLVFPESGPDPFERVSSNHDEHSSYNKTSGEDLGDPSILQSPNEVHPSQQIAEVEQNSPQSFVITGKIHEDSISQLININNQPSQEPAPAKSYQCDVCFKYFAKKQYLTKHKYRHREVKPHVCEICGKRFAQKFEVAVHKIKHTGERPYKCEMCQKEFRSKVNLISHRMRHTGEYPYMCSVCHKGMPTQLQLERHVSMHTGSLPYRCSVCSKGFFQKLSLVRHLSKNHRIQSVNDDLLAANEDESVPEDVEVMATMSSMETIPELTTAEKPILQLMRGDKLKVQELEINVNMEDIEGLSEGAQFSVVSDQSDYLLGSAQDIDSKFFHSILHQVRVEADCDSDNNLAETDV